MPERALVLEVLRILNVAIDDVALSDESRRFSEAVSARRKIERFLRSIKENGRVCDVEGCGRKHVGKGLCFKHWSRVHRKGQPIDSGRDYLGDRTDANEILSEDEFVRLKDLRSQGFTQRDVCYEIQRGLVVVRRAWVYRSYEQYRHLVPVDVEEEDVGGA